MAPVYWIAKIVKYSSKVSAFIVLIVSLANFLGQKVVGKIQEDLDRNAKNMKERMDQIEEGNEIRTMQVINQLIRSAKAYRSESETDSIQKKKLRSHRDTAS